MSHFFGLISLVAAIVLFVRGVRMALLGDERKKRFKLSAVCFIIALVLLMPMSPSQPDRPAADNKNSAERVPVAAAKPEPKPAPIIETPDEVIEKTAHQTFGRDSVLRTSFDAESGGALIEAVGADNLCNKLIRAGMLRHTLKVIEALKKEDFVESVEVVISFPMVDVYGEVSNKPVMRTVVERSTMDKIQFENFRRDHLPAVTDLYWEHPALSD